MPNKQKRKAFQELLRMKKICKTREGITDLLIQIVHRRDVPSTQNTFPCGRKIIWESFHKREISQAVIPMMLNSIEEKTIKQYSVYYRK